VLATPFSSEEYTPAEKHRKESSNHDVQCRQEKKRQSELLQSGAANIVADKRLENRQHVAAVFDHTLQNIS
jgi:hypothetical protein